MPADLTTLRDRCRPPMSEATARALVAEIPALLDALDQAHARGVAEERARVVAWLRAGRSDRGGSGWVGHAARVLADAIARGDHESGTAPAKEGA